MHDFVVGRVGEAEFGRVQCDPSCAARVGDGFPTQRTVVNFLAAQWVTDLGEVDANLVRAARFELTFDKRVALADRFDRRDMSDGAFAYVGSHRAAAPAIAPVADKITLDAALRYIANGEG